MARAKYVNFAVDASGDTISGAQVEVRDKAGSLVTLYEAETGATEAYSGSNPFNAGTGTPDKAGYFEFWVEEPVDLRITVGTGAAAVEYPEYVDRKVNDDVVWLSNVAAVIADTDTYADGTLIKTADEGFVYEATSATGNLGKTNAGGQEFDVVPQNGVVNLSAFDVTENTDVTTEIQDALDTLAPIVLIPEGTFEFTLVELNEGQTLSGVGQRKSILKIKDNAIASDSVDDMAKRIGVSAKDGGLTWVCVKDLEIDGNESNNRAWFGTASNKDEINSNNLNFSNNPVPASTESTVTPPLNVVISNVYSHDSVRNCIVYTGEGDVIIENSTFENSAFDHLIYTADTKSYVNNCLLRGFWDGAAYVCQGNQISNIKAENTASHPLGTDGALLTTGSTTIQGSVRIFEARDTNFDYGTNITNVYATQDPVISSQLAAIIARGVVIEGVYITFVDGASDLADYQLFGGSDINEMTVVGVNVQNAPHDTTIWEGTSGSGRELNNCSFTAINIEYRTATVTEVNFIISCDTAIKNTSFRDISFGDGVKRGIRIGTGDFENVLFENWHYKNSGSGNRLIELGTIGSSTYENVIFRNCKADAASSVPYEPSYLFEWRNCKLGSVVSEKTGTFTGSGTGSTTVFTLDNGNDLSNYVNHVSVVPKSEEAAGPYYLLGDGTDPETNAKIRYVTAPASGTDNVELKYRIGWSQ